MVWISTFEKVKKIKAIIVDDELRARDVLTNLLVRFCPTIEVIAACENLKEAVEKIKSLQPQVVFLDIEMPDYAGYEIVKFFDKIDFQIIFVTAYEHYAIRAFEIAAIDYLLKPIEIERLKQSIERLEERVQLDHQKERLDVVSQSLESKQINNLIISDRGNQYVVPFQEIIAFEALEAYSYIHTFKRTYTVSKHLKYYENLLEPTSIFFRTHKSWLINIEHVTQYNKSEMIIQLNQFSARLSKYKKAQFELLIGQK